MDKDRALRLALEALESGVKTQFGRLDWIEYDIELVEEAITAIKEALAQREQDGECKHCTDGCPACDARKLPEQEPVQVSPLEFVEMVMEKEHLIGNPIFWAEWPNKEKNT